MCAAEIKCPDGYTFILEARHTLNEREKDFKKIPELDRMMLERKPVRGTETGYDIDVCDAEPPIVIHVGPSGATYDPTLEEYTVLEVELAGTTWTLPEGTKISPIA